MTELLINRKIEKRHIVGLAIIVFGAVGLTAYAQQRGFSYKEVIVGLALLVTAVIVFGGERGIRFGFVLWVLTLALGYRTIELTNSLRIHPAEIFLWLLLVCILANRELLSKGRFSFPWWLWLFIPFWVLAWWPLIIGEAPWDKMLNEFRNFLLLIPLLVVASVVLERQKYWRALLVAFFVASSWIAFMGVVEYWFPDVAKIFPAFIRAAKSEAAADGFMRAQFSFWGGSQATFMCLLALPAGLVLANWWPRWYSRAIIVFAATLQMLAIYIGGYRSVWLVVLIQVAIASILRLKKHGIVVAILCIIVAVGGYYVIPNTSERVTSGIEALKGTPTDHSAQDRKDRALGAIDQAFKAPLGSGWSSTGWVHSDFLQVAANLGIIPGLIFLGGFLYTLLRFARQMPIWLRTPGRGDLALSLLLSFVGAGGLLMFQGVEVLPQLVLPVWFVWALVEIWLRQTSEARELSYSYAPANLYPVTNFQ